MHQRVLLLCLYLVGRESRRGKVYHKRKSQIALLYTGGRTTGDAEAHQHKSHVNEQQNLNLLGLTLILSQMFVPSKTDNLLSLETLSYIKKIHLALRGRCY